MRDPEEQEVANYVRVQTQKVVGHSFILMISKSATWLLALVMTIFLPRYLGDVGFGKLYFAMSFTGIFTIIAEFGLNTLVTREVSRDHSQAGDYFVNVGILKIFLWVFTFAATYTSIRLLGYPADTASAVFVLGAAIIFISLGSLASAVLQAFQKMSNIAFITALEKVVLTAFGVAALLKGYGFLEIAWIMLASYLTSAILYLCALGRVIGFSNISYRSKINLQKIFNVSRKALPFFSMMVLGTIYFRIDVTLLSKLSGDAVVGWYGAAYRLFETVNFLPQAFMFAFFPVFSQLFTRPDQSLKLAAQKSLNFLTAAGLPIALGTFLLASKIIHLLYGYGRYEQSIVALRVLAITTVFFYTNSLFVYLLMATDRQKKLVITAGSAAVLNTALNLIAIPMFRHVGAASTTLITEIFVTILNFHFLPRELISLENFSIVPKVMFAGLAMGALMVLFGNYNLILLLLLGSSVYFFVIWAIRALPRDDILIVKQALAGFLARSYGG